MTNPFYIIFDSEEEALLRSERAGADRKLSYSINGTGTRYWFSVKVESKEDPRAALILPTITEDEVNQDTGEIVNSRIVPVDSDILDSDDFIQMVETLPNDWVYPPQAPEEIIQPD